MSGLRRLRPSAARGAITVNGHRSGTPLLTRFNALIYQPKFRSGWGPDRRRSGPHPHIDFRSKFKAIAQFRPGSHFGADSQTRTVVAGLPNGIGAASGPARAE